MNKTGNAKNTTSQSWFESKQSLEILMSITSFHFLLFFYFQKYQKFLNLRETNQNGCSFCQHSFPRLIREKCLDLFCTFKPGLYSPFGGIGQISQDSLLVFISQKGNSLKISCSKLNIWKDGIVDEQRKKSWPASTSNVVAKNK